MVIGKMHEPSQDIDGEPFNMGSCGAWRSVGACGAVTDFIAGVFMERHHGHWKNRP